MNLPNDNNYDIFHIPRREMEKIEELIEHKKRDKNFIISLIISIIKTFFLTSVSIISFMITLLLISRVLGLKENSISSPFDLKIKNHLKEGKRLGKEEIDLFLKKNNIVGEKSHNMRKIIEKILRVREEENFNFLEEREEEENSNKKFLSLLFYGETGTGKSYMGNLIAKNFSSHYLFIPSGDFSGVFSGEQVSKLKKLFSDLKEILKKKKEEGSRNPVIVIIDEIDTFLPKKSFAQASDVENSRTVSAFQTCIDELNEYHWVLIATTNHKEAIEEPSLRRLGNEIKIEKMELNSHFISNLIFNNLEKHRKKIGRITIIGEEGEEEEWKGEELNENNRDKFISMFIEIIEKIIKYVPHYQKKVVEFKQGLNQESNFFLHPEEKIITEKKSISIHWLPDIINSSILNYMEEEGDKKIINNLNIKKLLEIFIKELETKIEIIEKN